MSDPSVPKRRNIPPPIQIIPSTSHQSAAEPMVIGTPIDSTSPSGSNLESRGPRSPSLNTLRKWRERFSVDLHSVLKRCTCSQNQSALSPLTEGEPEYPMVRLDRSRPRELIPVGATTRPEFLESAPSRTHLESRLIRRTQCFLVTAEKAVKNGDHSRQLGTCVMFKKQRCSEVDCTIKCEECEVCPHLFRCNCLIKFMGTEWCPHLHVMQELTEWMYLDGGLMFIDTNWRFTEMRHIRAFIQGKTKMEKKEAGLWEENFEGMMRNKIYRVKEQKRTDCVCKPDKKCPLCNACLCKYSCTCQDHTIDMQVCEHIHNVAMQKHERSEELFTKLEPFGNDYPVEDREDPNRRYYIEQEHEMSFYYDLSKIVKREKPTPFPTEWHMSFFGNDPLEIIVQENMQVEQQCYCNKQPEATKSNSCERCGICAKHYTCKCATSKFTICRHIHAVVRLEKSHKETPEQRLKHLLSLISRDDSEEDASKGELRSPLGPNKRPPLIRQSSWSGDSEKFFFNTSNTEL